MAPVVYNRRNKKISATCEPKGQVHPRQLQPNQEEEPLSDIGADCGATKGGRLLP